MGLTRPRAHQLLDIDYKQSVRAVTVANVTLAAGAPSVVDGVSLNTNDRILVTGQSSGSENGLYQVLTVGTGSNGTWIRTSDANQTGEIEAGMIVMVTEGTTYADTQWKLTTNDPITVGSSVLTFVINILSSVGGSNTQIQYNSAGTLAGSANLTWSGSELYVGGAANVSGNVTGNYFVGNGSQLTGITSEKAVLALGDSWIGGDNKTQWTLAAERAFQRQVVNQAVGSRTSTDVLANLATDVAAAGGYGNIALVVLGVGGNDKLSANANTIASVNATLYSNIEDILDAVTGNGVPVIMSPAPMVDSEDLQATGIPPDNSQFINTGQYYDDPEYANIANGYPGVAVATNSMSYLINNPSQFIITGGFHPTTTAGTETYVDIIASAAQGMTENTINAAIGQTLDIGSYNGGIQLGRTANVNTPYIDFYSSGNSTVDYDSRILATGGTGAAGAGNLTIYVNTASFQGNISATGSLTLNSSNAATAIQNGGGNGVGNIGTSTTYFNTVFAKATSAQYADVAEKYVADRFYPPGTVLEIGGSAEVQATSSYASTRIAGVVSTTPALLMNSTESDVNAVELALLGRVPCRVTGDIHRGDLLTSSDRPGVATSLDPKDYRPGVVLGKALESHIGLGEKLIEVMVGRL